MATIVTRSGKGVPLTATDHDNNMNNLNDDKVESLSDLSVNATATELDILDGATLTTTELNYVDGVTSGIQNQLDAKVATAGDTLTGDLSLGDNVKAKFGASDDLQIYHDGSRSYISDQGTGGLRLLTNEFSVKSPDESESLFFSVQDGSTNLYYDNSKKLATTSTGIDVTGSVTCDGLTVDGGVSSTLRIAGNGNNAANTQYGTLEFYNNDASTAGPNIAASIKVLSGQSTGSGGHMVFGTTTGSEAEGTSAIERLRIASNGDISFYEDTGTTPKFFWDASAESLGIGTSSPSTPLEISSSTPYLTLKYDGGTGTSSRATIIGENNDGTTWILGGVTTSGHLGLINAKNADMYFSTNNTERMRIDSSGNVLVGTTNANPTSSGVNDPGVELSDTGGVRSTVASNASATFNRKTDDGPVILVRKDGTTVGSIGTEGNDVWIGNDNCGLQFINNTAGNRSVRPFDPSTNSRSDNTVDLGQPTIRFDDIYATNGTIQTSDRNEKQDIEELSEAEQRVAVACKGLLRKFRWQDAVAEKGDDARIHFGIIAQDLQDAFTAEGLDAGRYAMFISTTWYEKQTPVDAVEAVEAVEATYDDEGNELTPAVEAVEAKDAYIRTDTEEEPTEGYTERTRLGVRYPELLAFIISAI